MSATEWPVQPMDTNRMKTPSLAGPFLRQGPAVAIDVWYAQRGLSRAPAKIVLLRLVPSRVGRPLCCRGSNPAGPAIRCQGGRQAGTGCVQCHLGSPCRAHPSAKDRGPPCERVQGPQGLGRPIRSNGRHVSSHGAAQAPARRRAHSPRHRAQVCALPLPGLHTYPGSRVSPSLSLRQVQ